MTDFLSIHEIEYVFRIFLAAGCGGLLGLEREKRAKNAGVRTHIIVAISSAVMMIVSKYGFFDVVGYEGISLDASRIAAGVVSAIGFLGTGVIFVRKENTIGVTTAAGLWATVGMGIAIGAGMYWVGIIFTVFLLSLQYILHRKHVHVIMQTMAVVSMDLNDRQQSFSSIAEDLGRKGLIVRHMKVEQDKTGDYTLTVHVMIDRNASLSDMMTRLEQFGTVRSIDILST